MRGLFAIILFGALVLTSCDKVKDPVQSVPIIESKRKVLIEDYTGHQCGNCPGAAEVAENLHKQYGDKVVVIAIHAGFFAKTNIKYPKSYTTVTGNEWDAYFIGNLGNPVGMINRKNYGDGLVQGPSKWGSSVNVAMRDIHYMDLDIIHTYDSEKRQVDAAVKAKFARSYLADTKVSLLVLEDSVIGPQLDYRLTGNQYVEKYVFMHMLRDAVNGTWGTTLKKAPSAYNDSTQVSFNYSVPTEFKDKDLYLVAFAFNESTREVLQVAKAKLKKAGSGL
jgi:thiol-disulfide isomerase/thioredoxin